MKTVTYVVRSVGKQVDKFRKKSASIKNHFEACMQITHFLRVSSGISAPSALLAMYC